MTLNLFIPGPPVAKGRPRVSTLGGVVRTYTPKRTASWEAFAVGMMMEAWGRPAPIRGALSLSVVALFPRPKRMIWKTKPMPREPHLGRPDADNLAKSVCDALEKWNVHNDSTIWSLDIKKMYAAGDESPGVQITLRAGSTSSCPGSEAGSHPPGALCKSGA